MKTDPYEMKNIADTNGEVVKNMTNTLNKLLMKTGGGDYNYIDQKCDNENKENSKRWRDAINDGGGDDNLWIGCVEAVNKIENWADD